LKNALRKVGALSDQEQNAIAAQAIETLEDEVSWRQNLSSALEKLRELSNQAIEEHRPGESRPLNEIL